MLGAARRIVISQEERRRTAYHESGHALLGMLQPGADPVRKISIIPRGQALGVTYQSPESDRYGYGESYLRGRLIGMLGGRAAEILIYGETTTGPESDLEQATSIARQMVGRWGMSEEVGAVSALPRVRRGDNYMPAGRALSAHARADRRGGQADHLRMRGGGQATAGRAPRAARRPRPGAARTRDARRGRRLRGGRHTRTRLRAGAGRHALITRQRDRASSPSRRARPTASLRSWVSSLA